MTAPQAHLACVVAHQWRGAPSGMATEQQIETVAIAIRKVWGMRSRRPKPRSWDKLPDQVRRDFMREAEAAIAAYEATLTPVSRTAST